MKNNGLILIALFFLMNGCSATKHNSDRTVTTDKFNHIKHSIVEKIEKGEIPSLTVAVMENDKIIWMESFGYADKIHKVKATPDTLYSIASITKSFTATGIMKLAEEGKIDLDADITNYLKTLNPKNFTESSKKVTCRNLLSHTSGLPMHFQYYYGDDISEIPDVMEVINKYGIIVTPPSSKYEYANLGYGILGKVISEVSGKSLNNYMTEDIFSPLGMAETTLDISLETQKRLASRYDTKGNAVPVSFSDTPGAGNASTTIYDLIQFGKFHLGNNSGTLLSKTTIQSMQSGQYADNSHRRNTYGLGWFHNDTDYRYKMVFHAGGMDGVDCMIRLIPEKNIVVAAISNQFTEYTHKLTEEILIEMIPDLKSVKGKHTQNQNIEINKNSKKIKQSDLTGVWSGHIITDKKQIPVELIFQEDGDIHVSMPIQFESLLLMTNKYKIRQNLLFNKWFFNNGHFIGWYAGIIPGEHLVKCPQNTMLNLTYKNEKLTGTATALASHPTIMHYALSHYMELEKKE